MHNHLIKYVKYSLILVVVLSVSIVQSRPSPNIMKNAKLYQVSKRNLLSKELNYIKSNPISSELKSFISRYKRKAKFPLRKREKELDRENMYVVKNGDIVPLNQMNEASSKSVDSDELMSDENGKFTVIPLIVPISVERDIINSTEKGVELKCLDDASPTTSYKEEPTVRHSYCPPTTVSTTTPTTTITTTEEPEPEETQETTTTAPSVNPKLLGKIFDDIKELMSDREGTKSSDSTVCTVYGDWDSIAGGMQIRITLKNDTHHPELQLVHREPPMEEGFLKEGNWTMTAIVPYTKASIIVLNAHTIKGKKFVGSFIGECKVCEKEETITGHWLLERQSKDCSDRQVSHKFISDVLKKNNVRHLQQQHLNSLVTVPSVPTVV